MSAYYLVRARWDGHNKIQDFVNNDEWINGSDTKFISYVQDVNINDTLLLIDGSMILYYAKCIENLKDGNTLKVDSWKKFDEPLIFSEGGY